MAYQPKSYRRFIARAADTTITTDEKKGGATLDINEFIPKCKELVADYTNKHTDISDGPSRLISSDDVYVVWYSKTLQNAKALLSTPLPDGMYYEVTLNGDKNEIYFDAYKKFHNMRVEV